MKLKITLLVETPDTTLIDTAPSVLLDEINYNYFSKVGEVDAFDMEVEQVPDDVKKLC